MLWLAAGPVGPHCSALNIMFPHIRIKLSRSQDEPAPAEGSETSDQLLASSAEDVRARRSTTAQMQPMANVTHMTQQYMGRLAYRYFNWRQDTWNDLQLFATINSVLLFLASVLKSKVIDPLDDEADNSIPSFQHFWQSVYEALVVVFGQDLPDTTASVLQQLWALMVAAVGLAAFALVLALVEQVVLEVLKNNVQRGSQVYEEGHILVLGFCDNQRDEELIWKILSQVCLAYRNGEPKVVVVMSQRPKLEMEATFRRIIPGEQRFGTRFVFREGSAIIPDNLRMVAASRAAATIIVSDSSRGAVQADAQALRAAVLLDELDFPGFGVPDPRTGHIVVEMRTPHSAALLKYSCSGRVLALPTVQLNARRIVRMVTHPVIGAISNMLWSFNSSSQGYIESVPQLQGKTFAELPYYFPDGSVFGLVNSVRNRCLINPTSDTVVEKGDQLIMMRPTCIASNGYRALPKPVKVDPGDWDPLDYVQRSQDVCSGVIPSNLSTTNTGKPLHQFMNPTFGRCGRSRNDMYMLPVEYTTIKDGPSRLLILGWGDGTLMTDLLSELDHGPSALPKGSEVTLFNTRSSQEVMGKAREKASLQTLTVLHVPGDPLQKDDLDSKLDILRYKCVIVLCDSQWCDPDLDSNNGIQMNSLRDMLRIDSMLMMVQLNIRVLLEAADAPDINIICEKVAFDGVTRFEDRYRLPLGVTVNMTDYSAQLATEVAYNPQVLLPASKLGEDSEVLVQDSGALADPEEELSFWQLQARAMTVNQVLFGYYIIPTRPGAPLEVMVNPEGNDARSLKRVWNKGDGLMKLICMAPKANKPDAPLNTGPVVGINTSDRNDTSTDGHPVIKASTSANSQDKSGSNGSVHSDAMQTHVAQGLSNNGPHGNGDGDGTSGISPMGSQLNTDVGSLKLTAPGTSRHDAFQRNSEDTGTADCEAD
ncbi:TPA: hypothetical protein ACH3X2_010343 [Trebouxia sp. C0005]